MSDEKHLLLKVVTPKGQVLSCPCKGVRLCIPDDKRGENGGWLGIRPGHEDALLTLAAGSLRADMEEKTVIVSVADGFVFVTGDSVTVMTKQAKIEE